MSAVSVGIVMTQGAGITVDAVNVAIDGAVDVEFVHDARVADAARRQQRIHVVSTHSRHLRTRGRDEWGLEASARGVRNANGLKGIT